MIDRTLPQAIEVFEVAQRRLYIKTEGGCFALFEDELTPEELIAIAHDIAARKQNPIEPVTELGSVS
ncbi:MAG TPA: hypothetical protein VKY92_16040 [Verrucomicrobiae bacterium]|jgi:hypothetical protein|nr:hypothetical protein [Verrucomicrobiae bacterium]